MRLAMTAKRRWRRRGRSEGSVAVEMALVTPVLLVLVFGAVDYGLMFDMQSGLEGATRAGAEYARTAFTDTTGIANQVTGADQMFQTTITPQSQTACTCIDGTVVACPTPGATNPCATTVNPYTNQTDPRVLRYVEVKASQNYAALVTWGNIVSASQTLNAGTVARIQ
jgi:Flp pilus assembly protein TadG